MKRLVAALAVLAVGAAASKVDAPTLTSSQAFVPVGWNEDARQNADGSVTSEFHGKWINYMDEADAWNPIRLTFRDDGDFFVLDNAPYTLKVPKRSTGKIRFEDTHRFDPRTRTKVTSAPFGKLKWFTGLADVAGKLTPEGIVYPNAFPDLDADLLIQVHEQQVRNLIVFHSLPHTDGFIRIPFKQEFDAVGSIERRAADGRFRKTALSTKSDIGRGLRVDSGSGRELVQRPASIWDSSVPAKSQSIAIEGSFKGRTFSGEKVIDPAFFSGATFPVYTDAVDAFFSGAGDGFVGCGTGCGYGTWAGIRGAATANADPTGADLFMSAGLPASLYVLYRGWLPVDTSGLPDGDVVTAATYTLTANATNNGSRQYVLVGPTTQASTATLANSDFPSTASNEWSARKTDTDWSGAGVASAFTLNAAGLAGISTTGYSLIGLRDATKDLDNVAPTDYFWIQFNTSETAGTSSDPVLSVTHSAAAPVASPPKWILIF